MKALRNLARLLVALLLTYAWCFGAIPRISTDPGIALLLGVLLGWPLSLWLMSAWETPRC